MNHHDLLPLNYRIQGLKVKRVLYHKSLLLVVLSLATPLQLNLWNNYKNRTILLRHGSGWRKIGVIISIGDIFGMLTKDLNTVNASFQQLRLIFTCKIKAFWCYLLTKLEIMILSWLHLDLDHLKKKQGPTMGLPIRLKV